MTFLQCVGRLTTWLHGSHLQKVDRREQYPGYVQGNVALTQNDRCFTSKVWTQLESWESEKNNINVEVEQFFFLSFFFQIALQKSTFLRHLEDFVWFVCAVVLKVPTLEIIQFIDMNYTPRTERLKKSSEGFFCIENVFFDVI